MGKNRHLEFHFHHHPTNRREKSKRLQDAINRVGYSRSISYHESGHTVLNYLLRGFHKNQIVHRYGGVSTNNFTDLLFDPLDREETLGTLLAGFGAERLLESCPHMAGRGTLSMQYSIENKISFIQPDTLFSLYIIRKIYGKKMSQEKQKEIIEKLVSRITQFFRDNPKLLKFIIRLSYFNQKKSKLDRKDINDAADYAQISSLDVVELANKFRNLNLTKVIQES